MKPEGPEGQRIPAESGPGTRDAGTPFRIPPLSSSLLPSLAPPSLRRRLLLLLLSAMTLYWLAIASISFTEARHEIDELFDAQLAQSAQIIMAQTQQEVGSVATEVEEFKHRYEQKLAFQVWDAGGQLVRRTANAPAIRLSDADSGFSDTVVSGVVFRVFSRWDRDHRFLVQVGQSEEIRNELATDIMLTLAYPALFAFPVLALLIWVAVGRGLKPLTRAAREVESRAPGNLTPIPPGTAPAEIHPLLEALNGLFGKLEHAFESERRFTADAAHELRTPLAALKTHCQVALRAADDPTRRRALEQVLAGVERATQLMQQLLTLARVDPEGALRHAHPLDLRRLAGEVLAEIGAQAVARGVELTLEDGPAPSVRGDRTMLTVLLRNLVDNAVRYTPPGGSVSVRARAEDSTPLLEVEDTGPGIPAAEREKVFNRFYRVLGSGEQGSGLGLSIVKRIAELHRAEVSLHDGAAGRGLLVRVRFAGVTSA